MQVLPAFLASLLAIPVNCKYIVPGGRWHDTNGSVINAHGAGITYDQKSGKFWWFGEYKTQEHPEGGGVSVYSSEDLSVWTYGGLALCMLIFNSSCISVFGLYCNQKSTLLTRYIAPIEGHPYISPSNIIQRPKVAYSADTENYHVCNRSP